MIENYEETLKLGLIRVDQKKYNESKKFFLQLTSIDPNRYEGYLNLSNILSIENKEDEARIILEKYLKNINSHPEIINGLAINLFNSKNFIDLNKHIDAYLKSHNNYLLNYLKGFCLNNLNKTIEAEKFLHKAIKLNNQFWHSYELLFNIFDLRSKISEMGELIEDARKKFYKNIKFNYFEALYNFRISNYNYCDQILNRESLKVYFKKNNSDNFTADYLNLLSKNYEKLSNNKKSLEHAIKRNSILVNLEKNRDVNKHELLDTIDSYIKFFKNNIGKNFTKNYSGIEHSNLTFLVGFPRSGTTLLDTILRTHSKTLVLEEKPYLINIRHDFFKKNNISKLFSLDEKNLVEMQKNYFKSFNYNADKIIIDKFPLNLIELGFIKMIFPNCKIILALRHPLDCILSCVLTSFKINEAMINFENLRTTAHFYNKTFNLLETYINFFNLNLYKIKYENVVTNFEKEILNLLSYLGLNFEDSVVNFHDTAKKREKIHTPSYHQVVKPIYKSSINRHIGFEDVSTVVDEVRGWIKHYGYDDFKI
mgnify:CR=1 FL=1|tara:strand:+ start:4848 stop:6461 length:1614 start_codon:yes stop_codon:yes gene_type:complete